MTITSICSIIIYGVRRLLGIIMINNFYELWYYMIHLTVYRIIQKLQVRVNLVLLMYYDFNKIQDYDNGGDTGHNTWGTSPTHHAHLTLHITVDIGIIEDPQLFARKHFLQTLECRHIVRQLSQEIMGLCAMPLRIEFVCDTYHDRVYDYLRTRPKD